MAQENVPSSRRGEQAGHPGGHPIGAVGAVVFTGGDPLFAWTRDPFEADPLCPYLPRAKAEPRH